MIRAIGNRFVISAATIVVVIPTLLIVLLFQKQIVAGIANGAVKE